MALPGLLRKVLNHLGFKKEGEEGRRRDGLGRGGGGGGFSTRMATPAPTGEGPVVSQCNYGNGGVQGLKWYSQLLRADEDGDVAHEFLHESSDDKQQRLRVDRRTRAVKLKGPLCAMDGSVHQFVELAGQIYWA